MDIDSSSQPRQVRGSVRTMMCDGDPKERPVPASPDHVNFSRRQMTSLLGRTLGAQYEGVLAEQLPDQIQALIEQLAAKERERGGEGKT